MASQENQSFQLVRPVTGQLSPVLMRMMNLPETQQIADFPYEVQERMRAELVLERLMRQVEVQTLVVWENDLRMTRSYKAIMQLTQRK